MKRASFLRNIATIALGGIIPLRAGAVKAKQQKMYLLQCFVAGFQYYEGAVMLKKMKAGDTMIIKREYNNPADRKAIALFYKDAKIGFIPARFNRTISKLLDTGIAELKVEITHIEPSAADWEKLFIAVYALRSTDEPLPKESEYLTRLRQPEYTSI